MSLTLQCQKRPDDIKPNALRRDGLIPATLYGHKGTESMQLMVNQKEVVFLLRDVTVDETVIEVKIPDLSWNGNVVVKEIQAHPWKRNLLHLSFYYVAANN
ncbi:MAG: 50S ribosomal protein L25 [Cyanobacteria bacterium P01_G01_bin.49]